MTASSGGALALASALVLGGVASNLYTYHRFTAEQDIAWLHFRTLGPQHYLARLRLADGRRQDLDIWGDEWQLGAIGDIKKRHFKKLLNIKWLQFKKRENVD